MNFHALSLHAASSCDNAFRNGVKWGRRPESRLRLPHESPGLFSLKRLVDLYKRGISVNEITLAAAEGALLAAAGLE